MSLFRCRKVQSFALININYPVGNANTDGIFFVLLYSK